MRTCGTSWTSVHTSVDTGFPDRAAQVGAPTNSRAAAVGTTVTSCPDSVKRRSSSQALYAAIPPLTPRTTLRDGCCATSSGRAPFTTVCLLLDCRFGCGGGGRRDRGGQRLGGGLLRVDVLAGQQVLVDLAERDREGLLLDVRVHERADVLQQALAELGVVGVDLTSTLGAVEHQLVLRVGLGQQVVDRGVGDPLGDWLDTGTGHAHGASLTRLFAAVFGLRTL